MVNANAKTPNKNRKSLPNVAGESTGQSPKAAKLDTSVKTPGKGKGNATPGKGQKSSKSPQQSNMAKTPKQTPAKNQNANASAQKSNKKNKRSSGSESESTPPKKLKMFSGTSELQGKQKQQQGKPGEKKQKRKGQFYHLKDKVNQGDKSALQELEEKIKNFETRKELTKTAKRKLKMLQKLKSTLSGEKQVSSPASLSKKRRERRQDVKAKHTDKGKQVQKPKEAEAVEGSEESGESDYDIEAVVKPDKIIKTDVAEGESDDDDDESGDEEESDDGEEEEEESGDEEDDDDDDDESNEEEEDEEEEKAAPVKEQKGKKSQSKQNTTPNLKELQDNDIINKKQSRYVLFVGNLPYDATKEEISENFNKAGQVRDIRIPTDKQTNKPRGFAYVEFHNEIEYQKALSLHHSFIKGRRINVLYTQGGKKKGEEKKNQVKAKNFKLQAMRNQGQLAGSVKQNQKRSFRRGNKGAVNGGD